MIESVDQVVTEGMTQSLTCPYTEEEVKTALFQMHPSKSPGPNGMSPFFFQKFWHIFGHDVTTIVLFVLHPGRYLRKMNYTHIVLIPKKKKRIQNILWNFVQLVWKMLYPELFLRSLQIG